LAEKYEFSNESANGDEIIKVHFKNSFRGADQDLATIDQLWQVSDVDSSQVIINNSDEIVVTSGTPLILEEGYALAIKSIDIDGNKVCVEFSKNGEVIDSKIVIPPQIENGLYAYSKDMGSVEDVELIKVHFRNSFRGADEDLATIDRIWQVSEADLYEVIINNSDQILMTSGTPLALDEGYELAIKSVDIDGNKIYVELYKDGEVIDAKIIVVPQTKDDSYIYITHPEPPASTPVGFYD
jgi:predicted RNA-binding protein